MGLSLPVETFTGGKTGSSRYNCEAPIGRRARAWPPSRRSANAQPRVGAVINDTCRSYLLSGLSIRFVVRSLLLSAHEITMTEELMPLHLRRRCGRCYLPVGLGRHGVVLTTQRADTIVHHLTPAAYVAV